MPRIPRTKKKETPSSTESNLPDDIHRGHTILELLAGGMEQLADRLDHGALQSRGDIEEGVSLHTDFLVGVLHRKEAMLSEAAAKIRGNPFRLGLAQCARQHARGAKAARDMATALTSVRPGDRVAARRLASLLRTETHRMLDHHNREEEELYSRLPGRLTRETIQRLELEFQRIRSDSAALESRITAWSSRWNPASD